MARAHRITSAKNPWFRRFREAFVHHQEEILLEGPKPIQDAVALGWTPIAIATDRTGPISTFGAPLIEFTPKLFSQISDTVSSQGMTALFPRPRLSLEALFAPSGVIVILDGIQDPGNVGTIIRLAAAFEASGVALTEGTADPWSPKTIRASAGTILGIPVVRTTRADLVASIRRHQFELWIAEAGEDGSARLPTGRIAIVFGSEGQGVSEELRGHARIVSIPISPRVESLNVASAAAILLARLYQSRGNGTLSA